MKLATLTTQQKRLLESFSEADGVVKFFIFDCKENSFDSENHRKAVILAFRELQRQYDDDEERFSKEEGIPISDDFMITIDEDAANCLIPAQISWNDFLGTRYNFERNGLIVRGNSDLWNEFFYYTDPVKRRNIIPAEGIDDGIGTGFAYAFSSPPWGGVDLSAEELGILFDQFLKFIICGSTNSIIYEWPTNWSNYLDTEVEWWGSFLWSLSNSDSNQIVVIAASTTG
ncbi:MAG: hypothetical protein CME33_19780 [Gimesia sp.]|uniref:hypothetical protein n=1 Tax=Gimesia sp. TaxID=2024833 RepID=UPI000C418787|nr:hypothetical protein [Gimesia sp.]MAX38804.1 hypothetical protein [Gimesia sp.]|tara:strand:+ start:20791 stop:21477 length:687 start_codon:yes stop_codon:yes gene_type:complete